MALGMDRLACTCSCINDDDDDNVDADVDDGDDDDDVVAAAAAAGREIVELLSDTDPAVLDVIALLLPNDDLGHINCQPSFQLNVDVTTVLLLSLDNFLLRYTLT